jgi:hypothetical protein
MTGVWAAVTAAVVATSTATLAVPATGLAEGSGLAASRHRPGVVWIVEDSGDPITRAVDADGAPAGSVTLEGWNNRDTEALATGPDGTLWIADIGDNRAVRDSVVVHVVDEPEDADDVAVTPTSYRISYPDGPRDAEAFLVDPVTGRAYLISKSLDTPMIYALPSDLTPGETHEVTPVADAPTLVTDATFTPDGARLVVRDYFAAFVYEVQRDADDEITGLTAPLPLDVPAQQQGESVAVTPDGATVLLGSEGADEPVHAIALPASTGPTATPLPTSDPTPSAPSDDPSPGLTPDLAEDMMRGLAGPVGTTLLTMGVITGVGIAGWLIWIRVHRSRTGRRRARER